MPTLIERLFARSKPVIAVVHAGPSPGVPGGTSVACAVERAVAEARLLGALGVDGLLIENAHDAPWVTEAQMGPEVAAFMTRIAAAVKRHLPRMPVGVQVASGAARTSLAVAHAAGCDFVRTEAWLGRPAGAVLSGMALSGAALPGVALPGVAGPGEVLRYRKSIGAEAVALWADLRLGPDDDAATLAAEAERYAADALVVAGVPGHPPLADAIAEAEAATRLPLIVAGGLTPQNLADYLPLADGFIVGRGCKEGGEWRAPICERRVRALVGAVEYARGQECVTLR